MNFKKQISKCCGADIGWENIDNIGNYYCKDCGHPCEIIESLMNFKNVASVVPLT